MSVEPLFVATMNALKSRLRLSGAANADALALIDQATEDVRVLLFDNQQGLGGSRVAELLAQPYKENATSASDLERTRANNLEVKWVRLFLLRRMPTLFMDASAVVQEVWNEEAITRETVADREISRLEGEIQIELASLLGLTDDKGKIDVILVEPDTVPDRPRDSIGQISLNT